MSKIFKLLFLALGLFILYKTIAAAGLEAIFTQLSSLGFGFVAILWVYPAIFAWDTLGWIYAFAKPLPKSVPFWSIYCIRIIGETLNAVIPFGASLGGEPFKVHLLKQKHGVPTSEGYASILIVHTTFWISLNIFVILALFPTGKTRPLTPVLYNSVLAFLIGLGIAAALLFIGLHLGVFKQAHKLGDKFKWWGRHSDEKNERFLRLDDQIREFYTRNPKRFILSALYNFLGWLFGAFEVLIIGNLMGMNLSFFDAWLFEALIQVLRIVTFFIPSSIGAQEGGIVLILSQFGYSTPVAAAFAMVRRIREILWVTLGLSLWAFYKERSASVPTPTT